MTEQVKITQDQIDAGAEALRNYEMGGRRIILPWSGIPNSTKRGWRMKASAVLFSAFPKADYQSAGEASAAVSETDGPHPVERDMEASRG